MILREKLGAGCALGCLQFFVCEQLARLGWPGHYSMRVKYISDLGERSLCAAHAVMNASFFAQALLIAGAALLLPRRLAPGVPRAALLLAALGLAVVALAPADVNSNLHISGARLHFAAGSLGLLLWGAPGMFRSRARAVAGAALCAAAVAIAGDMLLIVASGPIVNLLGPGTVERMAAYPLPLWLAFTGFSQRETR